MTDDTMAKSKKKAKGQNRTKKLKVYPTKTGGGAQVLRNG